MTPKTSELRTDFSELGFPKDLFTKELLSEKWHEFVNGELLNEVWEVGHGVYPESMPENRDDLPLYILFLEVTGRTSTTDVPVLELSTWDFLPSDVNLAPTWRRFLMQYYDHNPDNKYGVHLFNLHIFLEIVAGDYTANHPEIGRFLVPPEITAHLNYDAGLYRLRELSEVVRRSDLDYFTENELAWLMRSGQLPFYHLARAAYHLKWSNSSTNKIPSLSTLIPPIFSKYGDKSLYEKMFTNMLEGEVASYIPGLFAIDFGITDVKEFRENYL